MQELHKGVFWLFPVNAACYRQALFPTFRNGVINKISETYQRIGEQERLTLLILGR